jgi:hypothetical protein
MNKHEYKQHIEKELVKLNKKIDAKIILDKDYRKEAQEHRILVRKLQALA